MYLLGDRTLEPRSEPTFIQDRTQSFDLEIGSTYQHVIILYAHTHSHISLRMNCYCLKQDEAQSACADSTKQG